MNPLVRKLMGYVWAIAVLLVGWEILALLVESPALPPPTAALPAFVELFDEILPHILISSWRVLAALALGSVLAVPLGLALGRSPRADAVAAPIVFLSYPVPKVVFLPVLMLLLGLGSLSKITLITLIIFFQILVTARDAARSIPSASVLSVRSLGADSMQVFRHVVFPAALPDIFTALRIGSGTAVAVLFLAEATAGTSGLGWYIVDAWGRIDYEAMFAGILGMALLGVALYELLELLEASMCRWTRVGR